MNNKKTQLWMAKRQLAGQLQQLQRRRQVDQSSSLTDILHTPVTQLKQRRIVSVSLHSPITALAPFSLTVL